MDFELMIREYEARRANMSQEERDKEDAAQQERTRNMLDRVNNEIFNKRRFRNICLGMSKVRTSRDRMFGSGLREDILGSLSATNSFNEVLKIISREGYLEEFRANPYSNEGIKGLANKRSSELQLWNSRNSIVNQKLTQEVAT